MLESERERERERERAAAVKNLVRSSVRRSVRRSVAATEKSSCGEQRIEEFLYKNSFAKKMGYGPTDRRTDIPSYRDAWTHLKTALTTSLPLQNMSEGWNTILLANQVFRISPSMTPCTVVQKNGFSKIG